MPLSEILALPDKRAWLEGMGLTIPVSWKQSRHPTPQEVQTVVADLAAEQRLVVEDEFRIRGDDLAAILASGEAELVVTVAERLARACGQMILTMDWAFFTMVEAGTPEDIRWAMDDF